MSLIGGGDATIAERDLATPDSVESFAGIDEFIAACERIDAAGYRLVHGGAKHHAAVRIDDSVRRELDAIADFAPVHMPQALHLVDRVRDRLDVPHVACFDTAFHHRLPPAAFTYAIPHEWRTLGVRRFGFHGLSCAWSLRAAAALLQAPAESLQLIVAHLGAGASVTAIRGGHSVDTTMGFTPLEGLIMARRSGTVDPGALLWLQTRRGVTAETLSDGLEHRSGVLALSGTDDMREVLARAGRGDDDAALARDAYVRRISSHVGAVATSLERIDALVFTGGVGENADEIRRAVCAQLALLGVAAPALTPAVPGDAVVSAPEAGVPVLVVRAREDLQIAGEVRRVLGGHR